MTCNFSSYEKSFLVSNLVNSLHADYQVKLLFVLTEDFSMKQQSEIFALFGNSLNKTIFEASRRHETSLIQKFFKIQTKRAFMLNVMRDYRLL